MKDYPTPAWWDSQTAPGLTNAFYSNNPIHATHRTFADAPDEFVSEYSVPRIITQYQGLSGFQGLLLSTRDYPVSHGNCLSLALMIIPSIMNFQYTGRNKEHRDSMNDWRGDWQI